MVKVLMLIAGGVQQNPNVADAWNLLGVATTQLGNFDQAIGYIQHEFLSSCGTEARTQRPARKTCRMQIQ